MIEYRIGWSCNIQGASDEGEWQPYDGPESVAEDAANAIRATGGGLSRGLEEALEASGFDWWVEAREAPTVGASQGPSSTEPATLDRCPPNPKDESSPPSKTTSADAEAKP